MSRINFVVAGLAIAVSACKDTPPDPAPPPSSDLQTPTALPEGAAAGTVMTPPEALPSAAPPRDPSLARTFQGDLLAEIRLASGKSGTFRYSSDAEKARVQLQGVDPQFDILIDDDHLVRFDHDARTYQRHSLEEFDDAVERRVTVRQDVSGGRSKHAGVTCQSQTLRTDSLRVEACVRGLPGDFELGVLEGATKVRTPDWLVALLRQGQIPIVASGYDQSDRELFTLSVTRYAPDTLPEAVFEIPENYRPAGDAPER